MISQTIVAGIDPKEFNTAPLNLSFEPSYFDNKSQKLTTEDAYNLYSFSKESNTIVILLDAFQGNMFADIVDKHPDIIEKFDGFTYFPNTLSVGGGTWESIGAILGGGVSNASC